MLMDWQFSLLAVAATLATLFCAWPYLEKDVPLDPWGKRYNHRLPAAHNPKSFDLWTVGPDGKEIGNWK